MEPQSNINPKDLEELFESEPYRLLKDALDGIGRRREQADELEETRAASAPDLVGEMTLDLGGEDYLRPLLVMARVWGMDVTAIREFMDDSNADPYHAKRYKLQRFFEAYQDEAEARWLRTKGNDEVIARWLRHADSPSVEDALAEIQDEKAAANEPATPQGEPGFGGPTPPNRFTWKGITVEMEPIPWRLLNFLWEQPNRTAKIADAVDEVWGHDSDAMQTDGAMKSAIKKVNRAIDETIYRGSLNQRNGYLVLSKSG